MEVPEKFKSKLVGFRYLLSALAFMTALTLLVACGGSTDSKKTVATGETVTGIPDSIQVVSVTPETISLKGTGGVESSTIVFLVLDTNNQPISGETVNFSLSTDLGDISLRNEDDESDADGEVSVIVKSGNVPTAVQVIATVDGTDISTLSNILVLGVGLPDQDSLSLSVDIFNPEAWQYDGETITLSIRAGDHYNNPVPDGTAIYFTTEGGRIDPQCVIFDGECSVTWESTNPRPDESATDNAGLSTILATAIGEESFTDITGDGQFSQGDKAHWDTNPDLDLPEAFRDDNLNGTYDVGETFFDVNVDGLYTPANGLYDGSLCTDDGVIAGVCNQDVVHVRDSIVIAMSGSDNAQIEFYDQDVDFNDPGEEIDVLCLRDKDVAGWSDVDPVDGCNDVSGLSLAADPATINCEDVGNFYVRVADFNDNAMPIDTTVTATSSLGTLLGTSSYTVGNTIFPEFFLFSMQEVCGGVPEAEIEIKVVTPKGHETTAYFTVLDDG